MVEAKSKFFDVMNFFEDFQSHPYGNPEGFLQKRSKFNHFLLAKRQYEA